VLGTINGGQMRFRNLRIAWSAACLVAGELLLLFGVASYSEIAGVPNQIATVYKLKVAADHGRMGLVWTSSVGTQARILLDLAHEVQSENKPSGTFGFAFARMSLGNVFICPFWFPVVLVISLAAVPWIHWSRRFSLRSLLIVTTLIAIVLGLAVFAAGK
jgi:hypothetical protein